MSKFMKTTLWVLVFAFVIFYIWTRPEDAAQVVREIFSVFDRVGRFFDGLAR